MDLYILGSGFLSFGLYLLTHLILFRYVDRNAVFKWLFYLFCFVGLGCGIALWVITPIIFPITIQNLIIIIAISMLVYGSISFFYVLAIFGISVTSVRIHLLYLINQKGKSGISLEQILKSYNRETIVKNRLARLIGSRELKRSGKFYMVNKLISYFIVHTFLLVLTHKLYRGSIKTNLKV